MPHLVQMSKRYGKKGLQVIGAHVQSASDEKIVDVAEKLKINFPVSKGVRGPQVGANSIPKLLVFDTEGSLIFAGHPMDDADKVIKKALREVKEDDSGSGRKFGLPQRPKDLSEVRDWTNDEGKTIQAALVSVSGDQIKFRMKNGRLVDYPIAKLSEKDQDFVASKTNEDE
jgi:hypothetical protein